MRKNKIHLALLAAMSIQLPTLALAQENSAAQETANVSAKEKAKEKAKKQQEEQDFSDIEVITVGGMRASEVAAINMKRFSEVISDNLSAEEIGALPDQSIAESLERLTGVMGNQDSGRSNSVHVRGMGAQYTLTTLNNREIVSSFGSRSINLSLFPSPSIRKAQVYKTARTDALEGGIAGHINMDTFKPMSVDKNIRTFSATINSNEVMQDLSSGDKYGKRLEGMVSQHIGDDIAVSLGISMRDDIRYLEGIKGGNLVTGLGWTTDWNADGVPDEVANPAATIANKKFDIDQDSIFTAFEWAATDDLMVSVDYLQSKYEYVMNQSVLSHWGLASGSANGEQILLGDPALADIDPHSHYVKSGRAYVNNIGKWDTSAVNEDETKAMGLNIDYQINNDLNLNFDIAHSSAERVWGWRTINGKYGVGMTHYIDFDYHDDLFGINYLGSENVPHPHAEGSAFNRDTYELDTSQLVDVVNDPNFDLWDLEKIGNGHNTMDSAVSAVKLDLTYDFDGDIFHQVKYGIRFSRNTKDHYADGETYDPSTENWDQISDIDFATLAETLTDNPYQKLDKIQGYDQIFYFDVGKVLADKAEYLPERFWDEADRFESYELEEETTAAYIQTSFAGDWYSGIVGLRYYKTKLEATSWQSEFSIEQINEAGDIRMVISEPALITESNDYSDVLPSLNVNFYPHDDVTIRLGIGKAIMRPSLSEISSNLKLKNQDIDPNEPLDSKTFGEAGNPHLMPIESKQADISFEYYPTRWDYYALAYFYKDLDGIYEQGATYMPVEGQTDRDGNPLELPILSTVKGDGGNVSGIEFSFRQDVGYGFAVSGNYMDFFYDAVQDYNPRTPGQAPLTRPSELYFQPHGWIDSTYNVAITYDYGKKFSARLNFNEQSGHATRDGQDYAYRWPNENLSLNVKYKLFNNVTLFAQASNLLDKEQTKGNLKSDKVGVAHTDVLWQQEHLGISWFAGIRGNF